MRFLRNIVIIFPRILTNSYVDRILGYVVGPVTNIVEKHLASPTTTTPPPLPCGPPPDGRHSSVSSSPSRSRYLATHSIPDADPPITFLHAFVFICVFLFIYGAHTIYRQSNRLAELERGRIIAQANLDVVCKNARMTEKARLREASEVQQKLAVGRFLVEEAGIKLKNILERVSGLQEDIFRNKVRIAASEEIVQKQLNEMAEITRGNEKMLRKDLKELKLSYEKLVVKLRQEVIEEVGTMNERMEDADKGLLIRLEESNLMRLEERKGYLASFRTIVNSGEARENRLLTAIEDSQKRGLRKVTKMMAKNEEQHRDDMDKLRVDQRMERGRMNKGIAEREAQHAQDLITLRSEDVERQNTLFLSIAQAIAKDEAARTKEEEKALSQREAERVVLSNMRLDISRSANAIQGFKTKSTVQLMEQLRVRKEMQGQIMSLSQGVGECQRALELIWERDREGFHECEREYEAARIPIAVASPEASLQGLPTPAPSQSPPPREVTPTLPPDQGAPVVGDAASHTLVKLEDTSFDLQPVPVRRFSDTDTGMRIGFSKENAPRRVFIDRTVSLSKISNTDNLLSVSPPRWSDTPLLEFYGLDDACGSGHPLPNEPLLPSFTVSSHQDSKSESPESGFPNHNHLNKPELENPLPLHGRDPRDISPFLWPQGSVSEDSSNDAVLGVDRSDISLNLSTDKAGIRNKYHSPSEFVISTGTFKSWTSLNSPCASSPSLSRSMDFITALAHGSLAREEITISGPRLNCHSVTPGRNQVKPESDRSMPVPAVFQDPILSEADRSYGPANRSSSFHMSTYLPALASTTPFVTAGSMSPSPVNGTIANRRDFPALRKVALKSKRRKSYGDKPGASVTGRSDARHQSFPVMVSDLFNPA